MTIMRFKFLVPKFFSLGTWEQIWEQTKPL